MDMALLTNRESVFERVKQYNKNYAQNGDVFIVEDKTSENAGVYLDGQIIQLKTEVYKVNVDRFTGKNRFTVYRKREGIPRSFQENVAEALSGSKENNLSQYNCVEFVMELLEVKLEPLASDCMKIASGSKPKGFKVVKKFSDDYKDGAKLGDLFIVQSRRFGLKYNHAGVCCREKGPEVIQFMGESNGLFLASTSAASVSSSSSCPGVVNKVHINNFSSGRKYAIYRLKTFKISRYNCVHFALELIYGKPLANEERDVKSLIKQFF